MRRCQKWTLSYWGPESEILSLDLRTFQPYSPAGPNTLSLRIWKPATAQTLAQTALDSTDL